MPGNNEKMGISEHVSSPGSAVNVHGGTRNLSAAPFFLFQSRTGTIRPFGIKSAVEARLHLRVANIGHSSEAPKGKLG